MTITAKVRQRAIDTGKVISLVQAQHQADTIVFQIQGEDAALGEYSFYLLYMRPSDTIPHVELLSDPVVTTEGYVCVSFSPHSYFTAEDGTVKIQLLGCEEADLTVDPNTGTISGSKLWESLQGFVFIHASQLNGTETIIEENVLTEYLAEFQELYSQSEAAESEAADYAALAKDWASKTNGAVEGGEMSAKYYAGTADSRAKEAEGYAVGTVSGSPSATFAGKNAKELASDAQDWAKGTRSDGKTPSHTSDSAKAYAESAADSAGIVSAHATAIDAIGDDLTNIDAVAADILDDDSTINAVAENITNVNAVAANETNINAVNTNKTNIDTVAGATSNIGTVASNIGSVNAVAGNTTNINAVNSNKTNIDTVAGKATEITTVAGIASDVSAVAAIASDVAAVEDIDDDVSAVAAIAVDVGVVADAATDVAAVAAGITAVGTVATNISDVSAVADDIAKVSAVADDLTNIGAVADDLENIDDAVTNASLARQYAEGKKLDGTDVVSGEAGYEDNAKYWKEEAEAVVTGKEDSSNKVTSWTSTTTNAHYPSEKLVKDTIDAEIASREATDKNLEARLTNVETALSGTVIQEHVDSTQKNVKTILSADELLPWAILKRVGARSTQFNQLIKDGNFPNNTTNWDSTYGSISIANNKLTYTVETVGNTYQNRIYQRLIWFVPSHKYLLMFDVKGSRDSEIYGSIYDSSSSTYAVDKVLMGNITANSTTRLAIIFDIGANPMLQADLRISIGATGKAVGDTYEFSNVQIEDITIMNEYDSNKTDAQNIASFRAKFPASYYPFNAGDIYDVPPLSFLYRGTNQWDEEWELGDYSSSTGEKVASSNYIRCKNRIEVIQGGTYYWGGSTTGVMYFYDAEDNYLPDISYVDWTVANRVYTLDSRVRYIRFRLSSAYGTTYNHDIMICLNSVTDKTYKPYNGQSIDTSFMAGKKYVNSSCYDYAENLYVNGILKRKMQTVVGSVDLGTLYWTWNSTFEVYISLDLSGKANGAQNIICSKYGTNSSNNWSALLDHEISGNSINTTIYIKDSSINNQTDLVNGKINKLDGIYAFYELATLPDPTYGDPIPNFPCEDGSTITAITPQTDVENAVDVPSTIGYSTKIA